MEITLTDWGVSFDETGHTFLSFKANGAPQKQLLDAQRVNRYIAGILPVDIPKVKTSWVRLDGEDVEIGTSVQSYELVELLVNVCEYGVLLSDTPASIRAICRTAK